MMSKKTYVDEQAEDIFKQSIVDLKSLSKAYFNHNNCLVYV